MARYAKGLQVSLPVFLRQKVVSVLASYRVCCESCATGVLRSCKLLNCEV